LTFASGNGTIRSNTREMKMEKEIIGVLNV